MIRSFSNHFGMAVDFCQKDTISSSDAAFHHEATFPKKKKKKKNFIQ